MYVVCMNVGGFGLPFVGEREKKGIISDDAYQIKSFLDVKLEKNAVPVYKKSTKPFRTWGDIYIHA